MSNKYQRKNIGETHYTNEGCKIKIVDGGTKSGYCLIEVYGGSEIYKTERLYSDVKRGSIKNIYLKNKYLLSHIGEEHELKNGSNIKIIGAGSKPGYCKALIMGGVKNYVNEVNYGSIVDGFVKNKFQRTVEGVGYLGVGNNEACVNGNDTEKYIKWHSMINRCYSEKFIKNNPNYKNTIVCQEWYNFQNFGDWYDENYREFENDITVLDKDIIGDGKLYSPKTCCFVPIHLNNFFSKTPSTNSSGYKGISINNNSNKYYVYSYDFNDNKMKNLGRYDTIDEALYVRNEKYKKIIKEIIYKCINDWKITDDRVINALIKKLEVLNRHDREAH